MKYPKSKQQRGVSMLLAILTLAAILAIVLALASIMFVEINISGELVRSNQAFYGSFAESEDGTFRIMRDVVSSTVVSGIPTNGVPASGQVGGINFVSQVNQTSTPSQIVTIKASTTNVYEMLNSCSPLSGGGYGDFVLTLNSPAQLFSLGLLVTLIDYPASGTPSSTVGSWYLTKANQNASTTNTTLISPNDNYELQLKNTDSNNDAVALLQTYSDTAGKNGKGLPLLGQTILNVNGQNGDTTRRVEVTVPRLNCAP